MDMKKLSDILVGAGIFVTVGAIIWWCAFYSEVTGEDIIPASAFRCLYSSGGPCAIIIRVAHFTGKTPYNPVLFWIGILILGIGLIVKYSIKKEINLESSEKGIEEETTEE